MELPFASPPATLPLKAIQCNSCWGASRSTTCCIHWQEFAVASVLTNSLSFSPICCLLNHRNKSLLLVHLKRPCHSANAQNVKLETLKYQKHKISSLTGPNLHYLSIDSLCAMEPYFFWPKSM